MAELPYQPVSFSAHAALMVLEARRHLESIDTPVVLALPYKPPWYITISVILAQ